MRPEEITEEALAEMNDEKLFDVTASAILDSAVMERFPKYADAYHKAVDRCYVECDKRQRGIYQRAYNSVVREQGHRQLATPVQIPGA